MNYYILEYNFGSRFNRNILGVPMCSVSKEVLLEDFLQNAIDAFCEMQATHATEFLFDGRMFYLSDFMEWSGLNVSYTPPEIYTIEEWYKVCTEEPPIE